MDWTKYKLSRSDCSLSGCRFGFFFLGKLVCFSFVVCLKILVISSFVKLSSYSIFSILFHYSAQKLIQKLIHKMFRLRFFFVRFAKYSKLHRLYGFFLFHKIYTANTKSTECTLILYLFNQTYQISDAIVNIL